MQSTATFVGIQGAIYNFLPRSSLDCDPVQVIAIIRREGYGNEVTITMALKCPLMARFGGCMNSVFNGLQGESVLTEGLLKSGEFQVSEPTPFSLLIEKIYSDVSFPVATTFYSWSPEKMTKERMYLLQRTALATNLNPSRATNSSEFLSPLLSD